MSFDIDALLGEVTEKPLTYKKQTFTLPGELPGAALAPFLRRDLDLPRILAEAFAADNDTDDTGEGKSWVDTLLARVAARPDLPVELIAAAKDALTELLEAGSVGQAEAFYALRPSVPAYLLIASNVVTHYGLGLADFLFSSESSETDGEDSKPTSPTTTPDSTPDPSGDTPPPAA